MSLIDIIVPVYSDLGKTTACLESVLRAGLSGVAELQIIYDCGPEAELEAFLDAFSSAHGHVYLHKNASNLGFVKTVNRGFKLNPERDVIILNSDTRVYHDWIARLMNVAANDDKIATVTPFSNNAEICSFPRFCTDNRIPDHVSLAWLDEQFAKQPLSTPKVLPTGVGFCMWIRRSALNAVGPFDEDTFGRGYGEENDFCRRVIRAGYSNVSANNVFVYHEGGVSFGAEKLSLIERAIAKVEHKHPGYMKSVHEFIQKDELRPIRARVINEILRSNDKPLVLVITHNLAGGTKQYLDDLIKSKENEFETLVLQPISGDRVRLTLPEWLGESYEFDTCQNYELLHNYLRNLEVSLVFVNHIKDIESCAGRLLDALQVEVWCVLHDYYFISGNPTLTDSEGKFLLSDADTQLCCEDFPPSEMSTDEWRERVHKVLLLAAKVIAPSESVRRIYNRFFPELKISVYSHRDQELRGDYASVPVAPGKRRNVIAVIGALNKEKGADVLESVAQLAKAYHPELEFHLLGYAYRPLAKSVITSGPYREPELPAVLRELDPAVVWYPCQWPETYSYTLSRVLEAGYPLIIPNLGALADRTMGRPLTRVVTHPLVEQPWLDEIVDFMSTLQSPVRQAEDWITAKQTEKFYTIAWPLPERSPTVTADHDVLISVLSHLSPKSVPDERREWLLRVLFGLRQLPVLKSLAACIPVHRQRQLKRLLSSKPVHDVVR